MASNNTLLRTITLCRGFIGLRPLLGIGGAANEPALSIGDWVRQFLMSPPFAWRWNRSKVTVNLTAGQQDYSQSVANFGWMEKASIQDANGNIRELNIDLSLSESSAKELPVHVSAMFDDDNGNIIFRFMPVPDKDYTAVLTFQKAAPNFSAQGDSWTPIPDYLSYLVNQGFLAKSYEFANDERWGPAMQLFVKQVIAANAGLTDSQVNIFLSERMNSLRQQQNELSGGKQVKGTI